MRRTPALEQELQCVTQDKGSRDDHNRYNKQGTPRNIAAAPLFFLPMTIKKENKSALQQSAPRSQGSGRRDSPRFSATMETKEMD